MTYSIFDGTIADMTWTEVEAAARRGTPVIVPVGVIEQHGPHLPLGTDAYGAHTVARMIRQRLARQGTEILIAPPFYWGVNAVSSAFPGSIRTRPETARALLTDLCTSLAQDGLDRQFIVNHHGDRAHLRMLYETIGALREGGHTTVHWVEHPGTPARLDADPTDPLWLIAPGSPGYVHSPQGRLNVHATGSETTLVARYLPELLRFDELAGLAPTELTAADLDEWRRGGEYARRVTPQGYFGDPWSTDLDCWRFYERVTDAMSEAIAAHLSPAPKGT
jgi:creatinine amidohydrolase